MSMKLVLALAALSLVCAGPIDQDFYNELKPKPTDAHPRQFGLSRRTNNDVWRLQTQVHEQNQEVTYVALYGHVFVVTRIAPEVYVARTDSAQSSPHKNALVNLVTELSQRGQLNANRVSHADDMQGIIHKPINMKQSEDKTVWTSPEDYLGGAVRTFYKYIGDTPLQLGVMFDAKVLQKLPNTAPEEGTSYDIMPALPQMAGKAIPVKSLKVEFTPLPPLDSNPLYEAPHFDVKFLLKDEQFFTDTIAPLPDCVREPQSVFSSETTAEKPRVAVHPDGSHVAYATGNAVVVQLLQADGGLLLGNARKCIQFATADALVTVNVACNYPTTSQRWTYDEATSALKSATDPGQCLDLVVGAEDVAGAFGCHGGANQQWTKGVDASGNEQFCSVASATFCVTNLNTIKFSQTGMIESFAFSPNGKWLAVGTADSVAVVYYLNGPFEYTLVQPGQATNKLPVTSFVFDAASENLVLTADKPYKYFVSNSETPPATPTVTYSSALQQYYEPLASSARLESGHVLTVDNQASLLYYTGTQPACQFVWECDSAVHSLDSRVQSIQVHPSGVVMVFKLQTDVGGNVAPKPVEFHSLDLTDPENPIYTLKGSSPPTTVAIVDATISADGAFLVLLTTDKMLRYYAIAVDAVTKVVTLTERHAKKRFEGSVLALSTTGDTLGVFSTMDGASAVSAWTVQTDFDRCSVDRICTQDLTGDRAVDNLVGDVACTPNQGHLKFDGNSGEYKGRAFANAFAYGTYNGEFTLLAPRVGADFLQTTLRHCRRLRFPTAFGIAGAWPQRYCVVHDVHADVFTVVLDDFIQHE